MSSPEKIWLFVFHAKQDEEYSSDTRIKACLKHCIENGEQAEPMDWEMPAIYRKPGKKPSFAQDTGVYFSVSHSGDFWVCAIAGQEIGLDIQQEVNGDKKEIAKRFFHKTEYEYLERNHFCDFFALWAAKESYVKYTGSGIDECFDQFSVIDAGRFVSSVQGVHLRFLPIQPGYCLCLCAKRIDEVTVEYLETDWIKEVVANETCLGK